MKLSDFVTSQVFSLWLTRNQFQHLTAMKSAFIQIIISPKGLEFLCSNFFSSFIYVQTSYCNWFCSLTPILINGPCKAKKKPVCNLSKREWDYLRVRGRIKASEWFEFASKAKYFKASYPLEIISDYLWKVENKSLFFGNFTATFLYEINTALDCMFLLLSDWSLFCRKSIVYIKHFSVQNRLSIPHPEVEQLWNEYELTLPFLVQFSISLGLRNLKFREEFKYGIFA